MKISKKILVFCFITTVIAIVIYFYIWAKRKESNTCINVDSTNITEDYKFLNDTQQKYYSEKLKISLKIPKIWSIEETKNCTFRFNPWKQNCLLISKDGYIITIVKFGEDVLPSSKETLTKNEYEDMTKIYLENGDILLRRNIPIRLNEEFTDYSTVILDMYSKESDFDYIITQIIERNGYKYLILYSTPADSIDTEYLFRFSPYVKSMDRIISSIDFIK